MDAQRDRRTLTDDVSKDLPLRFDPTRWLGRREARE